MVIMGNINPAGVLLNRMLAKMPGKACKDSSGVN